MPGPYCLRTIPYVNESPLGAAYRSLAVRADGTISPALWHDHETGGWSESFDAAKHVRRLHADATFPALLALAVPGEIADDPSVIVDVFTLRADGTVLSPVDSLPANQLAVLARGWCSNP